jgi:1-acyl-sn-glycerol-3-phosphate acyltransferase
MLRYVAKALLWVSGWTPFGDAPDVSKAVFIAAPHTSNWDGIWGLTYKVAMDIDIRFFAKASLFWFPLGSILRGLGGIPLDRSKANSSVRLAVEMFRTHEQFFFVLAPEGTRSLRRNWKTGFYRIAKTAGVPIFFGVIDYGNKRVGIGGRLDPSEDQDADLRKCAEFYDGIVGRWPEKATSAHFAKKRDRDASDE